MSICLARGVPAAFSLKGLIEPVATAIGTAPDNLGTLHKKIIDLKRNTV